MDNDLIKMSQGINSTSPFVSNVIKPPKAPKKQPTPSVPPAAKAQKDFEAELIKARKERCRLQINDYLNSKIFGQRLIEQGFEKIDLYRSDKLSYEQMKEILDNIKASCLRNEKKEFVDASFYSAVKILSEVTSYFTKNSLYSQIPSIIEHQKKEAQSKNEPGMFDLELEEIGINIDPAWVPGPEKRIAIKLAKLFLEVQAEILKRQNQNQNVSKNNTENNNNKQN